jgi:hypothetical protein
VLVAEAIGDVALWTEVRLIVVLEVGTEMALVEEGLAAEATVEDSPPVGGELE